LAAVAHCTKNGQPCREAQKSFTKGKKQKLKHFKTMRVKIMTIEEGKRWSIDRYPNFHRSGSIIGMKRLYYGEHALLVRCGNYIYNVTENPKIYHRSHL